jgi:hypothetical protein
VWCVLVLVAFTAQATAAPRKVLVLPIDGNADAATRTKLTTSVQKLARVIDGQVQPGDTTFAETAAAVGCDPATPECAETVLTTLGVAEVVYGTATVQGTKVTVVVKRKVKDKPPKQQSATFAATTPAQAEPALLPLFTANIDDVQEPPPDPLPNPVPDPKPDPVEKPVPPPVVREPMSTKRALGYAAIAGGGAVLIAGLALWSSTSGMQDDIDRHSVDDLDDIRDLKALEDKAASRALFGNVCVIAALALAGYGGHLLYKDRERRRSVTVTPTPMPGGAGVTLTGAFR